MIHALRRHASPKKFLSTGLLIQARKQEKSATYNDDTPPTQCGDKIVQDDDQNHEDDDR